MGVLGALALDSDQLAVGLTAVLIVGGGDADDAPELVLAAVITDQHGQELADVEPIALGAAGAAIDLDAGGVDDAVGDGVVLEIAMEPEAVAAGLVAGENRGVVGEGEAVPCAEDLALKGIEIASGDGAEPRLPGHGGGEGEVPGGPAEFEREVERVRAGGDRMKVVGR